MRSLSSCIWSRMGRFSPQEMLRSPSMIRAPSSCGDPHAQPASQSSRTQGSLTTLTPPAEVSPGPGDSPVHSGPQMQPLIPGVPSSSRGRPTDFSVL